MVVPRPKKPKGKKATNKGSNSASEQSDVPPDIQMVSNHALSVTVQIRRGSRARKAANKTRATESQAQSTEQGAQAPQGSISALETQVAAAVQALADDYLAQLTLEPTTRTRGKRNRKVRSVSLSLTLYYFPIPILGSYPVFIEAIGFVEKNVLHFCVLQ